LPRRAAARNDGHSEALLAKKYSTVPGKKGNRPQFSAGMQTQKRPCLFKEARAVLIEDKIMPVFVTWT